jgi:hypothetical protein
MIAEPSLASGLLLSFPVSCNCIVRNPYREEEEAGLPRTMRY